MKSAETDADPVVISHPSENDVLFGKGHCIHNHTGNKQYRQIVDDKKQLYAMATKNSEKKAIAYQVLRAIQELNPPGKFLKKGNDGVYYEQEENTVVTKIKQALRENLSIRKDRIKTEAAVAAAERNFLRRENCIQQQDWTSSESTEKRNTCKRKHSIHVSQSQDVVSKRVRRVNGIAHKDMDHFLNLLMKEDSQGSRNETK